MFKLLKLLYFIYTILPSMNGCKFVVNDKMFTFIKLKQTNPLFNKMSNLFYFMSKSHKKKYFIN